MSKVYVRCFKIDTRGGFKDAEVVINKALESTTDEMVDIKNNSINKGEGQIIIVFEKKEIKKFKE